MLIQRFKSIPDLGNSVFQYQLEEKYLIFNSGNLKKVWISMGFEVSTDGYKRPLNQNTMKTLRSRSKLKVASGTSLNFTFSICSTDLFTSVATLSYALTSFMASWHAWFYLAERRSSNIFHNSVIRGQLLLIWSGRIDLQSEWPPMASEELTERSSVMHCSGLKVANQ